MSKERTARNGKIELMRFVFSVLIILYHCHRTLGFDEWVIGSRHIPAMGGGRLGPDFFFLVSGLLMGRSIRKERERDKTEQAICDGEPLDLGKKTLRFFLKKYLAIFPYHLICFTALFFLRLYSRKIWDNAADVFAFLLDSIPEFLLLQKFGFPAVDVNIVEWYLSAMLIAILLLYPIAYRYYSMFVRVIAPVLAFWILGTLTYCLGTFSDQDLWAGIGYAGLLRAIAEMSLGMSAFELSRYVASLQLSCGMRNLLTGAEVFGFLVTVVYALFGAASTFEIQIVLFLTVSIMLSFTGQTRWDDSFRRPWILWLGKMNLSFYLSQLLGLNIVRLWITTPPMAIRCLLVILITMLCALPVQYFGDIVKDKMNKIN
ncbi:MAG: acyltransferase [Lachnospiraceae bacterium]|nr:acyltransferase [Lachnospiraceae bacterium]